MAFNSTQQIVVLANEPVGTINPLLHGHFAEHLGELVYNGVWVDPNGPIANRDGLRIDVINALKPLKIPVLRWPGGCFADAYHWRDGIGPQDDRPMRINTHWGMAPEPNSFGTHEFIAFCREIGAEPYFAGNLGSGSPHELAQWIEYCNFGGDSSLSRERSANGSPDPFRIKYWGIGNENWGCGGNLTPQEYAAQYAQFRTFAWSFPDAPVEGIACGPASADYDWTEKFFQALGGRKRMVQGFAAHYYCGTAGTATEYTEQQWLELLTRAVAIENVLNGHRTIMDRFDPDRKIKLFCDEWGAWHPVEVGKPTGGLYQQSTIRDACVAAVSLDAFHRMADKLVMANIAQLINVLQSVLLVQEDKIVKTPTYHVFEMYQPHQGGTSLKCISLADVISYGEASENDLRRSSLDRQRIGLPAVHGSASVNNGVLTLTGANVHPSESVDLTIDVRGVSLAAVTAITLASPDIHAHNTFEQPDVVSGPVALPVTVEGSHVRATLAPGSVFRIQGRLQ